MFCIPCQELHFKWMLTLSFDSQGSSTGSLDAQWLPFEGQPSNGCGYLLKYLKCPTMHGRAQCRLAPLFAAEACDLLSSE